MGDYIPIRFVILMWHPIMDVNLNLLVVQLNASNTTVEQRMIANGVFGALSEAWNAFKQ